MNYKSEEHKYDKIINLPHYQSKKRKHMSMTERAAQFGAFRALTGYEEEVAETARFTEEKTELDEYKKAEINEKLNYINEHISDKPKIAVTYFIPDEKKSGGAYVIKKGNAMKIKIHERRFIFTDRTEIDIDEIAQIELEEFNGNE
ncbi:MAG: hypothetical protein SOZ34_07650 [Clostridia bacterium]|nr:hypothetical protein [Clostridia bacterium]